MLTRMIVKVVSQGLAPERCQADERFIQDDWCGMEPDGDFFDVAEKPLKTVQMRGV
ncbi:hypothetical protein SAMN03159306_01978 [Pseudomonas sp. NFACC48-1]|nr:hypothetical protein SAMN03159424_01864 [Pseudomonas sp. NFACC05-1]SCZ29155.1 hypothetical protein SAMN03159405_02183 [Pseudomonas sp. NFACC44-2]SDA62175.1 hypothetical protein SAMN03159429_02134 [Pseudomonas sp. NFACC51]SDX55666.1 hypothetical protein SAMN03159474_03294 [Pseudomonas sp. NFACC08-1]SFH89416.1 hypothetical protein SAMN03159302_02873 [Pseudomonas sp. NFACC54]SFL21631.1 hypothetical protein SAMN03159307_01309 [Pseudomonas sp. NFACC46-3]SFS76424.1 hypothetical protein SAMN03159